MTLPQFIDTAAKVAAAQAALDAAKARREESVQQVRDMRNKASQAESRLATEIQAVSAAQTELGAALLDGKPASALQNRVNALKNNVESLQIVVRQSNAQADALDAALGNSSGPILDADAQLASAEFDHLLAQYAKIIAPAIPLAVEIHLKAQRLNAAINGSGLLLDPSRGRLGRYFVDAQGNLFVGNL